MTDRVPVHPHAADKWVKRTPDDAIPIQTAWEKAQSVTHVVSHFNTSDHEPCDDVRLYHGVTRSGTEYTMLILKRPSQIITTYPYTGASDHLVEAYLDALNAATIYYE